MSSAIDVPLSSVTAWNAAPRVSGAMKSNTPPLANASAHSSMSASNSSAQSSSSEQSRGKLSGSPIPSFQSMSVACGSTMILGLTLATLQVGFIVAGSQYNS